MVLSAFISMVDMLLHANELLMNEDVVLKNQCSM